MTNPLQALSTYEGDQWEEYLEKLCLYEIFKELIVAYGVKPGVLRCVIRYIIWTYSKDSDKIILGEDWLENKKRIYAAAYLPPDATLEENILYIKDEVVLRTIESWLKWQDSDPWKEIIMLKELRVEMQISANSPIKNAQLEINYDQKFKNAKYSIDLYHMIKDAEQKLLQLDPKMNDALQEVKKASRSRVTMGPEMFIK